VGQPLEGMGSGLEQGGRLRLESAKMRVWMMESTCACTDTVPVPDSSDLASMIGHGRAVICSQKQAPETCPRNHLRRWESGWLPPIRGCVLSARQLCREARVHVVDRCADHSNLLALCQPGRLCCQVLFNDDDGEALDWCEYCAITTT
jgi:hypothetical protein